MTCQIFVEGPSDGALIQLAVADLAPHHAWRIVICDGANAARPMARKALLTSSDPVILVTDADTTDPIAAQARASDLTGYLAWSAGDKPFKLIQFIPESEVVFFQVPGLLTTVLDRTVDPLVLQLGVNAPKQAIAVLGLSVPQIAAALSNDAVERLRAHPLLAEVRGFLRETTAQHVS